MSDKQHLLNLGNSYCPDTEVCTTPGIALKVFSIALDDRKRTLIFTIKRKK